MADVTERQMTALKQLGSRFAYYPDIYITTLRRLEDKGLVEMQWNRGLREWRRTTTGDAVVADRLLEEP